MATRKAPKKTVRPDDTDPTGPAGDATAAEKAQHPQDPAVARDRKEFMIDPAHMTHVEREQAKEAAANAPSPQKIASTQVPAEAAGMSQALSEAADLESLELQHEPKSEDH